MTVILALQRIGGLYILAFSFITVVFDLSQSFAFPCSIILRHNKKHGRA